MEDATAVKKEKMNVQEPRGLGYARESHLI